MVSSARLTISIARSTPAQKPRGLARMTSMRRILLRRAAGLGLAAEQAIQRDSDRAADDRGVGDVERRPVPVLPVPLDEVDHVAVDEDRKSVVKGKRV